MHAIEFSSNLSSRILLAQEGPSSGAGENEGIAVCLLQSSRPNVTSNNWQAKVIPSCGYTPHEKRARNTAEGGWTHLPRRRGFRSDMSQLIFRVNEMCKSHGFACLHRSSTEIPSVTWLPVLHKKMQGKLTSWIIKKVHNERFKNQMQWLIETVWYLPWGW